MYWVDRAGDTIDKTSESGRSAATVIVPGTLANTPQCICLNLPSSTYWTDFYGWNEWSLANSTSTLRVNGSGMGTLAAVTTDGKDVYFADNEATTPYVTHIAVDTTGTPAGTISVGGTTGFTIESLLLDSNDVYFTVSNLAGKSYLPDLRSRSGAMLTAPTPRSAHDGKQWAGPRGALSPGQKRRIYRKLQL